MTTLLVQELPSRQLDLASATAPSSSFMEWAVPRFSHAEIDAAGALLIDPTASTEDFVYSLSVINNWRSAHAFPLNTFQMGLRKKVEQADAGKLIAQRVKRLSSIDHKLRIYPWLKLSAMQDLGGCRAVVKSVKELEQLVNIFYGSRMKHQLIDSDDYVEHPKSSGYRGVHLIYKYNSDRKTTYNGLKIEVQLRSALQHAWATAVETVGTMLGEALKSSQGSAGWLRFFALMGSEIAFRERRPFVPGTPTSPRELVEELAECALKLDAVNKLVTYSTAIHAPMIHGVKNARYFLLVLDWQERTISVYGFRASEHELALHRLAESEAQRAKNQFLDSVLVSVESVASLRRAYPNYFMDMNVFIREVRRAVGPSA